MKKNLFFFVVLFSSLLQYSHATCSEDLIKNVKVTAQPITQMAFSPNAEWLVVADAGGILSILYTSTWRVMKSEAQHSGAIKVISFSPSTKRMISASVDGTVCLWDTETWSPISTFESGGSLASGHFSDDGEQIVLGFSNGTIQVWDANRSKKLEKFKAHSGIVHAVQYVSNNRFVASVSRDGLKLWSTKTWEPVPLPESARNSGQEIKYSATQNLLALSRLNHTIEIWNIDRRQLFLTLTGHTVNVSDFSFFPTGNWLLSCDSSGAIRVWDCLQGISLRTLMWSEPLSQLAISNHGRFVVTGDYRGAIQVWNALKSYTKNPNVELKNSQGNTLVTLIQETPIWIEQQSEKKVYVKVRNNLKGWLNLDEITFTEPTVSTTSITSEPTPVDLNGSLQQP